MPGGEDKRKHLEFLQAAVTRMAGNSFLLKAWSVTVVSGLFALAADKSKGSFAFVALAPVLALWALDGYYLRQERLYRELYDEIRALPDSDIDYSMSTGAPGTSVDKWLRVLVSRTLLGYHGPLLAVVVAVGVAVG